MQTTSSSISSSEPLPSEASAWRPFATTFALGGVAIMLGLLGLVLFIDPFDRGLFGDGVRGVAEQGPRTADASRGRDPAFDGAIIGNSHIQLVSPAALHEATGVPFVSLVVPGTGPREQQVLLDYFLHFRQRPARGLVIGLDDAWCTGEPALPVSNPFPFWLYDDAPSLDLSARPRALHDAGAAGEIGGAPVRPSYRAPGPTAIGTMKRTGFGMPPRCRRNLARNGRAHH